MGESTKRGRPGGEVAVPVRNALDDTIAVEPSLEPVPVRPSAQAITSLPASERYRLGGELGRGGMGRVVEALDLQLGRIVAYKEVLPRGGTSIAKRFAREVQLTARLEHPSIVPLYDAGTTADGRPFYVMRRVSGRPLDQLMAKAGSLGERLTLLPAVLAAIDAVAHAHRRGVIHRDLKPANILVGDLGETVVIDWGLAKVIGEADDVHAEPVAASDSLRTQIGSVFGTPGFMAPEQARGEALDPRGDVYALGAILYQLLAGAPPHAGNSATEVIEKTGSREVTPVDVVAPGAPIDLVAIVGKALAFNPDHRYPNARALGEDVRRFLSGQLVAAHHYTPRQHLARFARRHRAVLSVAALAMVTVAVMAWIGVHRIVVERDAAERAHADAIVQRDAADRARAEVQAHSDQLMVANAQGLLEHNPTHAAALLKKIPEDSARAGDARAVAQAAIVRGAAWTMQLPDSLTVYGELSLDGKFFLQVGRDGEVRVWDLDRKKLVVARTFAHDARATWAGRSVFVSSESGAAQLVDPFTGASQPLDVREVKYATATDRGELVAYYDVRGQAFVFDVARKVATPLWAGHAVREIAIEFGGRWIGMSDKAGVEIVDPTGREITSRPGEGISIRGSRFDSLAVLTLDGVAVYQFADHPGWTTIDLAQFSGRALEIAFRGAELDTLVAGSAIRVVGWTGDHAFERMALPGVTAWMVEAIHEILVVPGNDGALHFGNDFVHGELHLPVALKDLKLYARPDVARVVAVGAGLLVGFELQASLPERLAFADNTTFVDDTTLLRWRPDGGAWAWHDVRTHHAIPFKYDAPALAEIIDVDASDGRVLVREIGNDSALVLLRKGETERRVLVRGARVWGKLMPKDALVFGVGDGRVLAVSEIKRAHEPGAPEPHEVVKLTGEAGAAVSFGDSGYAALSTSGELARGDYLTGALTRAHVAPGDTGSIAADRAGHVIVAEDNRVFSWSRDVVLLTKLDKPVRNLFATDSGALAELTDHSVILVPLVPGAPTQVMMPPSDQPPLFSDGGKLMIGIGIHKQPIAVELGPHGATSPWDLPTFFTSVDLAAISPSARRFVLKGFHDSALWTLPVVTGELRAWLDERTNAVTDSHDALAWPWQAAAAALAPP